MLRSSFSNFTVTIRPSFECLGRGRFDVETEELEEDAEYFPATAEELLLELLGAPHAGSLILRDFFAFFFGGSPPPLSTISL